eukprot:6042650-Amphidinium_carterae.1
MIAIPVECSHLRFALVVVCAIWGDWSGEQLQQAVTNPVCCLRQFKGVAMAGFIQPAGHHRCVLLAWRCSSDSAKLTSLRRKPFHVDLPLQCCFDMGASSRTCVECSV